MEERERTKLLMAAAAGGGGGVIGSVDVDVLRRTRVMEVMEAAFGIQRQGGGGGGGGGEEENEEEKEKKRKKFRNMFGRDLLEFAKENNVLEPFRQFLLDRLPEGAPHRDVLPLPIRTINKVRRIVINFFSNFFFSPVPD